MAPTAIIDPPPSAHTALKSASVPAVCGVQRLPFQCTTVPLSPTAQAMSGVTNTARRSPVTPLSSAVSAVPFQRAMVPPLPTSTTLSGDDPATANQLALGAATSRKNTMPPSPAPASARTTIPASLQPPARNAPAAATAQDRSARLTAAAPADRC